ncbi:MAG: SRPBCC family protein [Terriglobia bacterium]
MSKLTSSATAREGDYQCSIKAPISAKEAFDKISRVSEWWAKDFKGSARRPGDTFTVRFGETFVNFKIVEAVPDTRIVWQVADSNLHRLRNKTEWNGTSVVWELSPHNGTTTVTMTHRGLVPGIECYGTCEEGWNFYVAKSLLQFITEGEGLPDGRRRSPDPFKIGRKEAT